METNNGSFETTPTTRDITDRDMSISARIIVAVIMSLVTFIGATLNVIILLVVVRILKSRRQMSYWFVLNLCIIDGLASFIVLPIAIVSFVNEEWIFHANWCQIEGFLGAFFTFTSICTVCLTSIERFYSIKYPMHHSAHMTFPVTMIILTLSWILNGLIAALPLIGWHEYNFQKPRAICAYDWTAQGHQSGYIILTGLFCFIIPAFIMSSMYIGIYKVAKRSVVQVAPGELPQRENSNTTSTSTETSNIQRKFQSHFKAIKTLLLITGLFFILWGPYFCLQLYGVSNGYIPAAHTSEIIAAWLGFSSFAINPFVYGILNRSIREELMSMLTTIKNFCCRKREAPDEPTGNEDFLQFLERTSTMHNAKDKQSSVKTYKSTSSPQDKTLAKIEESIHM